MYLYSSDYSYYYYFVLPLQDVAQAQTRLHFDECRLQMPLQEFRESRGSMLHCLGLKLELNSTDQVVLQNVFTSVITVSTFNRT